MASKSDKSTFSEFALDGALGGSWERKKENVLNKSGERLALVLQRLIGWGSCSITRAFQRGLVTPRLTRQEAKLCVHTQTHTSAWVVDRCCRFCSGGLEVGLQRLHHAGSSGSSTSQVLLLFARHCCETCRASIRATPTACTECSKGRTSSSRENHLSRRVDRAPRWKKRPFHASRDRLMPCHNLKHQTERKLAV